MVSKHKIDWPKLVREFQASKEAVGVFCKRHGIATSTFHYWANKESPAKILPVIERNVPEGGAELILHKGIILRFLAGTKPEYIATILKALA